MRHFTILAGACIALSACAPVQPQRDEAARPLETRSDAERTRMLSHGYAQLYQSAKGLAKLDKLLLIKVEADATQQVIDGVADYAKRLTAQLEDLSRRYPSISLEDDGLPVLEKRKRKAQEKDYKHSLRPFKGATGADFERTLLLLESGALGQLRFLAQALADAEHGGPRHEFARGVVRELDRHYVASVQLLDRRFFKPPADSPLGAAGAQAPAKGS